MIHREPWFKEAGSREKALSSLILQFERDYISKEEFLSKLKRLTNPNVGDFSTEDILQRGTTLPPRGEEGAGLYLSPKFYEWGRQDYLSFQSKFDEMRALETQALRLQKKSPGPIDVLSFENFFNRGIRGGVQTMQFLHHIFMNFERDANRDIHALLPAPEGSFDFPHASSTEEFVAAYRGALKKFYQMAEQYERYLGDRIQERQGTQG